MGRRRIRRDGPGLRGSGGGAPGESRADDRKGGEQPGPGEHLFPVAENRLDDDRVERAIEWEARAITGESVERWYATGTSGPGFACAANEKQPCGWGAVKAMLGLARIPPDRRSPLVERAIDANNDFSDTIDQAVDGQSATSLSIASYVEQAVFAGREIDTRVQHISRGASAVGEGAAALGELSSDLNRAAQSLHQRAQSFVQTVAAA